MASTDVLLDHFPVNEAELQSLLSLQSHFSTLKSQEPIESLVSILQEVSSDERAEQQRTLEEALPELGRIFQRALCTVFVIGVPGMDENPAIANQAKLLEAQVSLLGRRGSRFLLQAIFDDCATDGVAQAACIMDLVQRLVLACIYLDENHPEIDNNTLKSTTKIPIDAWVKSIAPDPEQSTVSWAVWFEWGTNTASELHRALSTVFHGLLLGPAFSFRPKPLRFPVLEADQNGALWKRPFDSMPTSLAFMSLGGRWRRLYGSDQDGLSFPIFRQALLGYQGPTLILVQTVAGDTLGYYSESPWRAPSKAQWLQPDGDAFLFRLDPVWNVYSRSGESDKFMHYLYTSAASSRSNSGLSGLAVGGVGIDTPRLHINPTLERCQASAVDTVFQSGPLLSTNDESFFDVDTLQVWAVNVTAQDYRASVKAGQLNASIKEQTRLQFAQVDRAQFVDDFASGAFMNSLYKHRSEARGRADFVAGDEEGDGYYVNGKAPSARDLMKNEHRVNGDDRDRV